MRRLIHCTRGSISVIAALSAVPLIGMAALGTEVGSWYLIQRHAQNAADAAAIAGALTLATTGTSSTNGATSVAAANGFCDGCGTQSVKFSSTATSVTAMITQTQTAWLSSLFGLSTIPIPVHATASIRGQNLCMVSLTPMKVNGSFSTTGGGCSIMTNGAITLAGSNTTNVPLLATNGCGNSATICDAVALANWYMPPATVPSFMTALDAVTFPTSASAACNPTPNPPCKYETAHQTNGGTFTVSANQTVNLQSGTYIFYNTAIDIKNNGSLTNSDGNGVNIVLLGTSSLKVDGTVQLTANLTNLLFGGVLNGILIYDRANGNVDTSGDSAGSYFGGAMYFPNAAVTWGGNADTTLKCTELVANNLSLSGNANLDLSGCKQDGIGYPTDQVVVLTQ
jgi:Flp pilus assembly protein TadG